MIRYVSGTLVSKKPTQAIVEVGGIGYEVLIPTSTYEQLPDESGAAKLYTYHYVREDQQTLFGFSSEDQRSIFEVMLGVSGVGPKLALAALSAMRPSDLRDCVVRGEVGMLTRIPGVGRKTAERMIVELRDRFDRLHLPGSDGSAATSKTEPSLRADALGALQALGVSKAAAEKSVDRILLEDAEPTVEDLIRRALQPG